MWEKQTAVILFKGLLGPIQTDQGLWTWRPRITGHAPWAFSISLVNSFGVILFGCTSLFIHQFQAEPSRCSRWVASIIERIDLGVAGNLMRVLISLTEPIIFNFYQWVDIFIVRARGMVSFLSVLRWVLWFHYAIQFRLTLSHNNTNGQNTGANGL